MIVSPIVYAVKKKSMLGNICLSAVADADAAVFIPLCQLYGCVQFMPCFSGNFCIIVYSLWKNRKENRVKEP